MGKSYMKGGIVLLIALLLTGTLLAGALAAESKSFTVVNSKDWHDLYLGTIYASATNSEFVFFTNLADTQLKTKMMAPTDKITVFESKNNPVVKNYPSLLKVNAYKNVDTTFYDSFYDLQKIFVNNLRKHIKGFFVFDASFGMNPVAAAPYLVKNSYFPLFLDEQSFSFVQSTIKGKNTYIAGHIPVRQLEHLQGTIFSGFSYETLDQVTKLVINDFPNASWGVLIKIDIVDLAAIKQKLPVFVFYGDAYLDTLADLLKQTNITDFEVIGGPTADVARALEIRSQRNLNFMLKYGRRVTNYPGFTQNVLELDSAPFPYPIESLIITNAIYYPNMGVLAITFDNKGNVPLLQFSNLEFAGSALSDTATHFILQGEQKTIPFQVLPSTATNDLTVTTRYGESIPLQFEIGSKEDSLFYQKNVTLINNYQDDAVIQYVSSVFDTTKGQLELTYKNPTSKPIHIYAELFIDDAQVLSSPVIAIPAGQKDVVIIKTPFIPDADLLKKSVQITTYYGHKDTLLSQTNTIVIKEKGPLGALTGWVTLDYSDTPAKAGITTIVILFIIALLLFFIFRRKKNKNNKKRVFVNEKRRRSSKKKPSFSKKATAKKSVKKSSRRKPSR